MTRARPAPTSRRALKALVADIRACRICRDAPQGTPLPHEPRPVLRVSMTARIGVFGQAPGTRVHASGAPFTDPSGVRLRQWMGVTDEEFYDVARLHAFGRAHERRPARLMRFVGEQALDERRIDADRAFAGARGARAFQLRGYHPGVVDDEKIAGAQ